jgi:hypothetical protein
MDLINRTAIAIILIGAIGTGPLAAQRDSASLTGQQVIAAAIARKHALLATLHDYEYQVSVKFVVRDLDKPPDSVSSLALISETRSTAYWRSPGHYHESIIARRRVNHLNVVWNTVSVGDIAWFQQGRVEILPYSFHSPIADDAMDHYCFRMQDTLVVDGRRVFRLAIEPRSESSPSFTGVIDIIDSTYDVMAIDVGVNDAARFGIWKQLRYQQRFEDAGDGRWMPREIRWTGEARLGLKIPRTPRHLAFEQEARLDDFRFDAGTRSGDLNEVRVVVDQQADHADSAAWSAPGEVPLTVAERREWDHRDSVIRRPPGLIRRIGQAVDLGQVATTSPDFFHFNRVDGAYVGVGTIWRRTPAMTLTTKVGYAAGSERWHYRVGGDFRVSEARRLWLGVSYHDETVNRPSLIPHAIDPSIEALLYRRDPLDYYRETGLTLSAAIRPFDFTRLDLHYNDQEQSGLPVVTDFSLLKPSRAPRLNGYIVDGRMRTLSGTLTYDSRSLLRRNGLDSHLPSLTWTRITMSAEVAAPSLIPDDFDFGRYSLQVERHQRTFKLGITTINALVGITSGTVPPQRYFTIDFGMRALGFEGGGFRTLGDTGFAGNRVLMLSVRHDFDRLLFAKSGLPLIRHLPFTFRIYGGMFAIDFLNHTPFPGDSAFRTASSPYSEAGFVLGNLLPFISPLSLGAQFTWQLSSQSTRRFQFGLSLTRQ